MRIRTIITLLAAMVAMILPLGYAASAQAATAPQLVQHALPSFSASGSSINCHVRWHLDFYAKKLPHMRFHYTHVDSDCHLLKSEAELRCLYPPHAIIIKRWFGNPIHTVGPYSRTTCKPIKVGNHTVNPGGATWVGYRYFRNGKWVNVKVLPKSTRTTLTASSCHKNQQEIGFAFSKTPGPHGLVEITRCPVYHTRAYITCEYHAEGGANTTKTFTGQIVSQILVPSKVKCATIPGTQRFFKVFGSEIHERKNGHNYWGKCQLKPTVRKCT